MSAEQKALTLPLLLKSLGLVDSSSQAMRLIAQGGVKAGGDKVQPKQVIEYVPGLVLQVGKRKFIKLAD